MIFEVKMVTLEKFLVDFPTDPKDVQAQGAYSRIKSAIQEADILHAKVPRTMGDQYPVRINAVHIVSYEPYTGPALIPAEPEDDRLCHHKDVVETSLPGAPDDRLTHYLCLVCNDTFPLIGDTDQWKPCPVSG